MTYRVMISSTTKDLIEHRQLLIDAVIDCGMMPLAMNFLGATGKDPVTDSIELVDQADIYFLIIGKIYGSIPENTTVNPDQISITEMEYRHAMERPIPKYIFIMDDEHVVTPDLIEAQLNELKNVPEKQQKLAKFKATVRDRWVHTVATFKSPHELAGGASRSLYRFKEKQSQKQPDTTPTLPIPPAKFAAPPYSGNRFIGRQAERQLLTNWFNSEDPVMVVRAIGGQGKSALMWDWFQSFNDDRFAGKIWWSFDKGNAYQQDGRYLQTFLRYAIAYMVRENPENLKDQAFPKLAIQFITLLQQQSYLVVLDGLERLLIAYNRMDASHIHDENVDETPELRTCISPQDASLLQQLIHCKPSKILIGSRLFPSALDDVIGNALPGVRLLQLPGLQPQDALELIGQLGVKYANSERLSSFLKQLGYHGLMLVVAAGHICGVHRARGNFDIWYSIHGPKLFEQDLIKLRHQLLQLAIDGMSEEKIRFFEDISAFRGTMTQEMIDLFNPYLPPMPPMPQLPLVPPVRPSPFCLPSEQDQFVSPDEREHLAMLRANLLQEHKKSYQSSNAWLQAQGRFDRLLQELEVRGLLEWNRESGIYDLHPVVRAFAHDRLEAERQNEIYGQLRRQLELIILSKAIRQVRETSELNDEIEYYNSLLKSGNVKEAVVFFSEFIHPMLITQLDDYPTAYQLLSPLIEAEYHNQLQPEHKATIFHNYSLALEALGQIERAANFASQNFLINIKSNKAANLVVGMIVYARHTLAQNRLADALQVLEIAERASVAARLSRQLAWVHEYQAEIYALMGMDERSQELIESIELDQTSPHYKTDQLFLLETISCIQQHKERSAKETIIQLEDRLQAEWQYALERFYHQVVARQAWLDKEYGKAEIHFNESIRINNATGRPVALEMIYLASVLQETGSSPQTLIEKTLTDALSLPSRDRDKAQMYFLAAQFYMRANKQSNALDMIRRAWTYAVADGAPYVHARILSDLRSLGDIIGETLPSIPDYAIDSGQRIPYKDEILKFIDTYETGVRGQGKPLPDSQFSWNKVTLFQVCAVCTFGLDIDDNRVWQLIREIHGLSGTMYNAVLYVNKDDSTKLVVMDRPFEQIRPHEAQMLYFNNDIKSDIGTITLITGTDNEGDYYAFVYCLAQEVLRFAKDCESGNRINLKDYFVKLLYEGRGTCVSSRDLEDIGAAYKIRGDCLTIIVA